MWDVPGNVSSVEKKNDSVLQLIRNWYVSDTVKEAGLSKGQIEYV